MGSFFFKSDVTEGTPNVKCITTVIAFIKKKKSNTRKPDSAFVEEVQKALRSSKSVYQLNRRASALTSGFEAGEVSTTSKSQLAAKFDGPRSEFLNRQTFKNNLSGKERESRQTQ